ncbi:MAG: hypothetical protein ACLPWF_21255 [Bryobacteraceae bacterium]
MPNVLFSIFMASQLALAIALMRKYIRTRDAGFIWLGAAILVWPLASNYAFQQLIGWLAGRQPIGFYPFSLVEQGQLTVGELVSMIGSVEQIIGVALFLVAVLYLSKGAPSPQSVSAR